MAVVPPLEELELLDELEPEELELVVVPPSAEPELLLDLPASAEPELLGVPPPPDELALLGVPPPPDELALLGAPPDELEPLVPPELLLVSPPLLLEDTAVPPELPPPVPESSGPVLNDPHAKATAPSDTAADTRTTERIIFIGTSPVA